MEAVNKLLDTVKLVCSLPSDLALADRIGVSRQLVSQWRKGANPIAEGKITTLCKMAKLDTALWNAEIQAEQAQEPEVRSMYRDTWKRLTATIAVVLCAIGLSGALSGKAYAVSVSADRDSQVFQSMPIMSKGDWGWWWKLLRDWLAWRLRGSKPTNGSLDACHIA